MSRTCGLITALALLAGGAAGCDWGDQGPANPVALPQPPTPALDAGSGDGGGSPNDAGPRQRTVSWRNPLGGPVGNLLVDGDFEWSAVRGSSQVGWSLYTTTYSRIPISFETAGLCRTGLRCAVLERGRLLYGRGTAARGTGMVASVWARIPEPQACGAVRPAVIGCNSGFGVNLLPRNEQPDVDGWCEYLALRAPQQSAQCMYIENGLLPDTHALIDSAQLIPDTGTVPMSARPGTPLSAEQQQRARAVAEIVRRQQWFGMPPERSPPAGE